MLCTGKWVEGGLYFNAFALDFISIELRNETVAFYLVPLVTPRLTRSGSNVV